MNAVSPITTNRTAAQDLILEVVGAYGRLTTTGDLPPHHEDDVRVLLRTMTLPLDRLYDLCVEVVEYEERRRLDDEEDQR